MVDVKLLLEHKKYNFSERKRNTCFENNHLI